MRRTERIKKKQRSRSIVPIQKRVSKDEQATSHTTRTSTKRSGAMKSFYEREYKKLLILPFTVLLIAIILIGAHIAAHNGDFVQKSVSLKGGVLITAQTSQSFEDLVETARVAFPNNDVEGRILEEGGRQTAIIISADVEGDEQVNQFIDVVSQATGVAEEDLSVETIGSSLGSAFFDQTLRALFIAFLFMGYVVFLYFGENKRAKLIATALTLIAAIFMFNGSLLLTIFSIAFGVVLVAGYARYSIPSVTIMLSAFSNIIITLAVVNLLGIKLGTAGIAAFLMLIGYSVDTNVLLSTRVIKRKVGTVHQRVMDAVNTGLTMNITTLVAIGIALAFSQSEVISQIMAILIIGLVVDMMNTWIQNVGILKWYLERRGERL